MLRPPYNHWPYSETPTTYSCAVCGIMIGAKIQEQRNELGNIVGQIYYPACKYWNVTKKQAYCSPDHSLQAL